MALLSNRPGIVVRTQRTTATLESVGTNETVCESVATNDGQELQWIAPRTIRTAENDMHPWDVAHGVASVPEAAGLESFHEVPYVEPDFDQNFPYQEPEPETLEGFLERAEACPSVSINSNWPSPTGKFAWHLDDEYSQLRSAREAIGDPGDGNRVLIGILDTGYDPGHATLPRHLRYDLARNLTGDGPLTNATDPGSNFPMTNPGHGTATLALLAGNIMDSTRHSPWNDFLGGTPHAEVVPIRIANSVVHFRTSAMAQGIEYAANIGCQVLSISMGGVPSKLWADAVNLAYEKGLSIFAAAGNRIGPAPPATLVYPARFNRVVAVCGFTSDRTPYEIKGIHREMQGCFGPASAMSTAMAGFTPNTPWAYMGCGSLVNPNGAGTSSATPQCAAAATLWLQKHRPQTSEKWRIVESVRHALFSTADKSPTAGSEYYGNGLLSANAALETAFRNDLPQTDRDRVSFPWLRLIGALEGLDQAQSVREEMFETEALQLYLQSPRLQKIGGGADPQSDDIERPLIKELATEMGQLPNASRNLRTHLAALATSL